MGRFHEFPKGKLIVAFDGDTNIFQTKDIIGNHQCLTGGNISGQYAALYQKDLKSIFLLAPGGVFSLEHSEMY